MYDVTALGEVLIDFTPSGTSKNGQRLFEQNPGGAPANVLAAINKCGLKTAFIGKVGNDMHGLFLKEELEKSGTDCSGLIIDETVFTTLAFVSLNEKGERSFSFARKPGADTQLKANEIKSEHIIASKLFHMGSLSLTDEPSHSATFSALNIAKENNTIISYDPNYRAMLWDSQEMAINKMRSVIPYVNVMKISDEETDLLTPHEAPEEAAAYLIAKGVSIAVVTLGAKGCYVRTREGGLHVPGFPSQVVDTTGAGDSFWGGFLFKLLESGQKPCNVTLEKASTFAAFGNAMASLCVEKCGGIPAIPDLGDVLARLDCKKQ